jgi:hypothetical protein
MTSKIVVKVLCYKKAERYAVERIVRTVWNSLGKEWPDLGLEIIEVREIPEILKYTPVIAFVSLVIDEKLVCIGRIPKREEMVGWLRNAAAR